jgi:hypothetical protein
MTIPISNPRTCALVGLSWPVSQAEFESAWRKKFGDGAAIDTSSASQGERAKAQQQFLDEVKRFQAKGFDYTAAWTNAMTTPPGRDYYLAWMGGPKAVGPVIPNESSRQFEQLLCDRALVFPNEAYEARWASVANSENGKRLLGRMHRAEQSELLANAEPDPNGPTKPGERYDASLEADARTKFVQLTEQRALSDMRGADRASLWADTSSNHPQGKQFYATWKRQQLLKKREELQRKHDLGQTTEA